MNLGHFPTGERVRASLDLSRAQGVAFETAWEVAMRQAHLRRNGRPLSERQEDDAVAMRFAKPAFRRAYEGEPPERPELTAHALLQALEHLYDQSEDAERVLLEDLMEAA